MKVLEHYTVPLESLPDFLSEHLDEKLTINSLTETEAAISIEQEYTTAEMHMGILRTAISNNTDNKFTAEEIAAMEYSINAIKTLIDMGVIE